MKALPQPIDQFLNPKNNDWLTSMGST